MKRNKKRKNPLEWLFTAILTVLLILLCSTGIVFLYLVKTDPIFESYLNDNYRLMTTVDTTTIVDYELEDETEQLNVVSKTVPE